MTEKQKRILHVLQRMQDVVREDEYFAEFLVDVLDLDLDAYAQEDGFGTEQQCDPRGDFRDGSWSIVLNRLQNYPKK